VRLSEEALSEEARPVAEPSCPAEEADRRGAAGPHWGAGTREAAGPRAEDMRRGAGPRSVLHLEDRT
jgi:hypothetical protein